MCQDIYCRFGAFNTTIQATYVSDGVLECITPIVTHLDEESYVIIYLRLLQDESVNVDELCLLTIDLLIVNGLK